MTDRSDAPGPAEDPGRPAPDGAKVIPGDDYAPSALPSTGARVLAFSAILVAGLCGGLIGYAVIDLQCEGDCTTVAGLGGLFGAVAFAVGVGIVSILALRAMGEWRVVQHRQDQHRPDQPGPGGAGGGDRPGRAR